MFHLIGWDLVYVSLLLHQYDSLHGLVGGGVVLGELSEASPFPPERILRHDATVRLLKQGCLRYPNPRTSFRLIWVTKGPTDQVLPLQLI